jgi:hypothetical protein
VLLKLRPIIFSIIFLLGLELIIFKYEYVYVIAISLFLLSLIEGYSSGKKWIFSILPAFFTISSIALLYLIAPVIQRQTFILLSSLMYYLSLFSSYRLGIYIKDQTANGMNKAATAATIFFAYASAYGLYLNYLVPLYMLMLAYLLITLLVSYQNFYIIRQNNSTVVWAYSFILSLAMAELIWTMNYWPFGYLTTGVIALILYYVLWDLIQSYFLDILKKRRVVVNMVFFSIMIVLVLLSAKWVPVI